MASQVVSEPGRSPLDQLCESRAAANAERCLEAELVTEDPVIADEHSLLGLVELLLKDPERVDRLNRDVDRQVELIPRFLAVALASFMLFGVAMTVVLNTAPEQSRVIPSVYWSRGRPFSLVLAYTLGLVAATGVCLPSFYFYGLLSGVKLSMLQVTAFVTKGKADTAIMLAGILPIYLAIMLGVAIFRAPGPVVEFWLHVGLMLPFVAGLWGVRSIYRGIMALADTLPLEQRYGRTCFLRRLVLSWAACYTAVSPIMIYRLWQYFAGAAL